jgi:hypothetical protein
MEYANLDLELPDDILYMINKYEPDSRTYAIRNKPTDITYWNKNAVNKEVLYGTTVKKNYTRFE